MFWLLNFLIIDFIEVKYYDLPLQKSNRRKEREIEEGKRAKGVVLMNKDSVSKVKLRYLASQVVHPWRNLAVCVSGGRYIVLGQ